MTTVATEESHDRLGEVARLLHIAALEVYATADQQPADSPLHSLGLGVLLAQTRAAALLPDGHQLSDVDEQELHEQGVLQLLTQAEELTRPLPAHRVDFHAVSDLVIDLCDLIREARGLGC